MADIKEVIAAVNPDLYFGGKDKDLKEFKRIIEKEGISKGIKKAKEEKIFGAKSTASYKMVYDAQTNQLEPNYYWILDFVQDAGVKVEKIVDNFVASPGSGQFSEMGQKKAAMQQQVAKISGDLNQVTKSIIQLIYDLREFEIRLTNYDDLKSKDKLKAEAALIGLKQIWLDSVDIKKGHGAIHQMASQGGFTTVRDLFMMANSLEDVEKMSKEDTMNDQVKRILLPRVAEFFKWVDFSEKELRKRYAVEKSYLKSQVKMVQLYTSWIKPYLKAADELRQSGFDNNAALVNAFSTSMMEMTLLGKKQEKSLPPGIENYKMKRDYHACYVISLKFRGPSAQRTQTGDYAYTRGGRLDMTFDCYALNDDELKLIKKELEKDNLSSGLEFFATETGASLDALKEDLEYFLKDEDEKKKDDKKDKKKDEDDVNPFSALADLFSDLFKSDKKKKDDKKELKEPKDIQKDNFVEKGVREIAAKSAKSFLYAVYDIYKKSHGMASSPENFDN